MIHMPFDALSALPIVNRVISWLAERRTNKTTFEVKTTGSSIGVEYAAVIFARGFSGVVRPYKLLSFEHLFGTEIRPEQRATLPGPRPREQQRLGRPKRARRRKRGRR
jgi:hypothetical protein